jgi:hypothetical protein
MAQNPPRRIPGSLNVGGSTKAITKKIVMKPVETKRDKTNYHVVTKGLKRTY